MHKVSKPIKKSKPGQNMQCKINYHGFSKFQHIGWLDFIAQVGKIPTYFPQNSTVQYINQ